MIRGSFLDPNIRSDLIALVRDGKAETRLTRRANALLLLDDGMSCTAIAKVLYLDDDTIRYWYQLYNEKGLTWLADFGYKGRACELTAVQQEWLATIGFFDALAASRLVRHPECATSTITPSRFISAMAARPKSERPALPGSPHPSPSMLRRL